MGAKCCEARTERASNGRMEGGMNGTVTETPNGTPSGVVDNDLKPLGTTEIGMLDEMYRMEDFRGSLGVPLCRAIVVPRVL